MTRVGSRHQLSKQVLGAAVRVPRRQFGGSSADLPAAVAFGGGSNSAATAWDGKIGRAAPACDMPPHATEPTLIFLGL